MQAQEGQRVARLLFLREAFLMGLLLHLMGWR